MSAPKVVSSKLTCTGKSAILTIKDVDNEISFVLNDKLVYFHDMPLLKSPKEFDLSDILNHGDNLLVIVLVAYPSTARRLIAKLNASLTLDGTESSLSAYIDITGDNEHRRPCGLARMQLIQIMCQ